MIESTALLIALALWLGPNMMVLVRKCSWFNPAVPAVEFAMNICWATVFTITVVGARIHACVLLCLAGCSCISSDLEMLHLELGVWTCKAAPQLPVRLWCVCWCRGRLVRK